jgi:DnaJ-class molecular chaperone with C-terminal Zn finger domain
MNSDGVVYVTLEDVYNGAQKKVKILRRLSIDKDIENCVDVDIKMNCVEGDSILVPNMGHFINYANEVVKQAGDCVIYIKMLKHDTYTRKDLDLHTTLEITFDEAKNGFNRSLRELNGKIFHIILPKIHRSDMVHFIPNKGLHQLDETSSFLYISFIFVLELSKQPTDNETPKTTKEQKNDIQKLVDDDPQKTTKKQKSVGGKKQKIICKNWQTMNHKKQSNHKEI